MTKTGRLAAGTAILALTGIFVWAAWMNRGDDPPPKADPTLLGNDLGSLTLPSTPALPSTPWCVDENTEAEAGAEAAPVIEADDGDSKVRVQVELPRDEDSVTVVTVMLSTETAAEKSPRGQTASTTCAAEVGTHTRM